jgi:hypothetical protein
LNFVIRAYGAVSEFAVTFYLEYDNVKNKPMKRWLVIINNYQIS